AIADRERAIEDAQAYESSVVPTARGEADKIHEDAEAYKARMVALAEGNASLFTQIEAAYARAPQVTRERLYLETMEDILERANKVIVESKPGAGGNLIYLPLDKLIGRGAASPGDADAQPASPPASASPPADTDSVTVEGDRSR